MNSRNHILIGVGLLLALAPTLNAAPHKPKPAPTKAVAAVPDTPAVAAVRAYVAARQAGEEDVAYALLSPVTQAQFPAAQRDKVVADANLLKNMPPGLLPVLALFADAHNTLHFKFNVLGASPDDPNVALVRTYQVGTPLRTVRVLKVVTVSDPGEGGIARLDGDKTMLLAAPEIAGMRALAQQASSQSNLRQLSLALIQYQQDHDQTMPDADRWMDGDMPYVKSEAIFHDPSAPPGEKWNYAFNRNLSGVKTADIASPATTVLLFESTLGTKNASDTGESVPAPGRHNNGTDYAKADGHVLWLADGTQPSFLLSGE